MASTSRPNYTSTTKYDVFLSFRGEDTGYSFTDHLYKALLRAGLLTFRGMNAIQFGHQLKPETKDAIIASRAFIVVLSENYASSKWCLDELSLILEQTRKSNHYVFPLFYRTSPLDVRKQGQSFSVYGSNWSAFTTFRWKQALIDVANLRGRVLSGYETYETDFIEEVVKNVNDQLNFKPPPTAPIVTPPRPTKTNPVQAQQEKQVITHYN